MVEMVLEIRGTPLSILISYLEELDGLTQAVELPMVFNGPNWSAEIESEENVQITSRFYVNAVHIRFSAPDESKLAELIARFRKKTLRVGG
jgi:hypothetical protein